MVNPYKETPYFAGAIYLCVINLPRKECFKEENMILIGIEPKQQVFSPMIRDLELLHDGVTFRNSSTLLGLTSMRATLACVACDLPAT